MTRTRGLRTLKAGCVTLSRRSTEVRLQALKAWTPESRADTEEFQCEPGDVLGGRRETRLGGLTPPPHAP